MTKDKMKGFISGILVMAIAFALTFPVYGLTGSRSLVATYNNIKLYVNRSIVTPKDANGNTVEPFIYNGTVYLPVRAVAGALGQEVSWNPDTKSVYIGSQPEAVIMNYSRNNPAPIGTIQTIDYSDTFDSYNASVTVNEIERGARAWAMIENANMFNNEPKSGCEYIVARIKVTMNSVKDDAAFDMSSVYFKVFNSTNAEYDGITFVVPPEPALSGSMYSGSTKEGYVVFEVKDDDAAPKMVFGSKYDGTGGVWFKLYQ